MSSPVFPWYVYVIVLFTHVSHAYLPESRFT